MTVPDVVVDRSSPVPLYFQAAQQIEAAILSGQLPIGQRLENEVALADIYGLSRPTMRAAIAHLVNKGLLVRKRGVGTKVVRQTVERAVELTSLYDDLAAGEQDPTTEVLLLERREAPDDVAENLKISAGDEVVHIERLRCAAEVPLAVLRNWLPVDIAGDLTRRDLEEHGLYELMRGRGTDMRDATQRIGAVAATAGDAKLLGVRKGSPLLTMERHTFDRAGRPVELGSHLYESSRYSFTVTLHSR